MKSLLSLFLLAFSSVALAIDVASLHPLMTGLVKEIGGDKVRVVEIGRPGLDVHNFRPKSKDLAAMAKCSLIVASGKGIEPYLSDLKDSLQPTQTLLEVGRSLPSQKVGGNAAIYVCCPSHSHGGIDPHWWHNVRNMERAGRIIGDALSKADPAHKSYYKERTKNTAQRLRQLDRWVKKQVSLIPKKQRHLVTSHAAFGYFCKAYGFKASYVQGLSRNSKISTQELWNTINSLKKDGIKAVFPEVGTNPKTLKEIAKNSGAKVSKPLIADGSIVDYQKMIRANVEYIVAALK